MEVNVPIIRICEVISVDDPLDGGRIKVMLRPSDNDASGKDEIDYAFPLLPKMFHVQPKRGESVLVITATSNGHSQRFYVGPVISQLNNIEYDPHNYSAQSLFRNPKVSPLPALSLNPETEGAYPEKEDINILSRKNADIQLKPSEVRIKAGVKNSDGNFNTKDPAYIKVAYHDTPLTTDDGEGCKSTATIVADRINLIGNNSSDPFVKTTDKKDLITDEEMQKLLDSAHELPYGDKLVEFLKLFRDTFLTHVHPMPTCPPCSDMTELRNYDLDDIISDSVRIN